MHKSRYTPAFPEGCFLVFSSNIEHTARSGDPFYWYLSHAENVIVGNTVLRNFYYYLVFENKRDIALLGFDFIDSCFGSFDVHNDIIVTGFDEEGYGTVGTVINDNIGVSQQYHIMLT